MTAIASRKNAEAPVPIRLPIALKFSKAALQREGRRRDRSDRKHIDSEWPSEKNKPTEIGRLPSCISLRTTLSMVAM